MSKTVYSFHSRTGAFMAPLDLDQGDLSPLESGTYLIPGNCLEAAPPTEVAGRWPFAVSGAWVLRDLPARLDSEITLEEHRARLKAAVTAQRWLVETGGITLPNGVKVKTGIEDQSRIAQLIEGMEAGGCTDVPFKAESGWLTLTLAQMSAVRKAVASHVRACFETERARHEAIDTLDASAIGDYDVLAGWPNGQA